MKEKELVLTEEKGNDVIYDLHKVEKFDPWKYLEPMKSMTTREDIFDPDNNAKVKSVIRIDALLYWFRLRYPEGSILVEEIPKDEEDIFYFKASVYADRNDAMPLATGSARRVSCEDEEYPAYETAETLAIRTALRYAGFGPEIYAKDSSVNSFEELVSKGNMNANDGHYILKDRFGLTADEKKPQAEPQNAVLSEVYTPDEEVVEKQEKEAPGGLDELLATMAEQEIGENAIEPVKESQPAKKKTAKKSSTKNAAAKKAVNDEKDKVESAVEGEDEMIDVLSELEAYEKENASSEIIELTKEEAGETLIAYSTEDIAPPLKKLLGKPINKIPANNLDYLLKNCENQLSEETKIAIKTYLN